MNQFFDPRSVSLQCLVWFFTAATFCDGANLDDLISPCTALHDDAELLAIEVGVSQHFGSSPYTQHNCPSNCGDVIGKVPPSRNPDRTIIDQDSPSLAREENEIDRLALAFSREYSTALSSQYIQTEILYLRFHSLLI